MPPPGPVSPTLHGPPASQITAALGAIGAACTLITCHLAGREGWCLAVRRVTLRQALVTGSTVVSTRCAPPGGSPRRPAARSPR